jgi:hypothetical protein
MEADIRISRHFEQIESLAHVWMAEDLWLSKANPCQRIERVSVGRGYRTEIGWRIAFNVDELSQ